MEIYKKLLSARENIKKTPLKKEGLNKFSGYEYFKPSQISDLAHTACMDNGLFHHYSLEKNGSDYVANLVIINCDNPEERLLFTILTSIPDIKATNEAQKLGGAVTYSQRYLLMIAFDIVDNSLDFDTTENTEKQAKKTFKSSENKKLTIIPEITPKFFKGNWDGSINDLNQVVWNGELYQLSEKANKQLRDHIDSEIDRIQLEQMQQNDIDFIDNIDKHE
jgi:hypothetical protein